MVTPTALSSKCACVGKCLDEFERAVKAGGGGGGGGGGGRQAFTRSVAAVTPCNVDSAEELPGKLDVQVTALMWVIMTQPFCGLPHLLKAADITESCQYYIILSVLLYMVFT